MSKEIPQVKFNTKKYDIDEVLDKLEKHGLIRYKNDARVLLSKHPQCQDILGLLNEFDELRNYVDSGSISKIENIAWVLLQLDSPILIV